MWGRFGNWFNWGVYDSKKYFDYCVFGHRHTPMVKDDCLPGSIYVNVGDWLLHRNYAVYHDGTLRLIDLLDEEQTR